MSTLSDALAPHAARIANQPRVYIDANVPANLVAFMRETLKWDVLFVIEHDDLRRARDDEHYVMARQLRRTLITLDRDYLDDRRFPPGESGGVLVLTAPDHRGYAGLLSRLDREVFRLRRSADAAPAPLAGRKLHLHVDWPGDATIGS
jgi:predicted nuclease of predicted toxin-antitoxin system